MRKQFLSIFDTIVCLLILFFIIFAVLVAVAVYETVILAKKVRALVRKVGIC